MNCLITVDTEIKVKLIPRKYFFAFAFVFISYYINLTDDLSHSCLHGYFTPNYTFAFAFVVLKVINSEIILFRFALISVSMVILRNKITDCNNSATNGKLGGVCTMSLAPKQIQKTSQDVPSLHFTVNVSETTT